MNNAPIIIVEGPDGAGKSTLIKEWFNEWKVIHDGPLTDPFSTYIKQLNEVDCPTVFDRFFYSEMIYGPVMRSGSKITPPLARMLERVLLAHRAVVILCLPEYEVTRRNYMNNRSHEYVDSITRHAAIYRGYAYWLRSTWLNGATIPGVVYNYTIDRDNPEHLARILEEVNERRGNLNRGPGIGNFKEGVTLMVGDECSHGRFGNHPFVDTGASSYWLTERLIDYGVSERDLYWVNATVNGVVTGFGFVHQLKPSKIIALGKEASRMLQACGIGHFPVPHPQYWKRFHNRRPYPLEKVVRS